MNALAIRLTNGQNQSENYDGLLKNSIRYFLGKYPRSIFRLSNLVSVFHRVILDSKDPSLEIMWFYGAITFHKCNPSILSPQAKLVFAKELLELLNSCLCSGSVVKKLAVIAPVLYLLYHLHFNFSDRDPSFRVEIRNVVEEIVSYISICCAQYFCESDRMTDSLGPYILDLVRVWTVDQVEINNKVNVLTSFFPTLDNEFQQEVTMSMGYLVGVVMHEALLLRLCLKISPRVDKEVLRRDMLILAIQTIKGFQNFYFLDMLLKMLLEPHLPAAVSLSSEDAVLLRKALYDAVILVDYSFYSGRWAHSDSISHSKNLSLVWVLAADHAIQFARATMDEDKVDAYLNAYCESQMVTELIKWVNSQIGMVHPNSRPEITTPRALIYWLLALENHGLRVFDDSMSLLRAKALACLENEPPQLSLQTQNVKESRFDLNVISAEEDQELDGQLNNVPGDLCLNMEKDGGKRKEAALTAMGELPNKQIKLDLFGFTVGKFSPLMNADGSRCESPIIISSDDEMNVDKQ